MRVALEKVYQYAICSDSQALATPKVNSALVAETVCALKELSVHNGVQLVWTPGHCGILGMKRQMAYQGKPLQSNTLVQNQFLALCHQLYIMNYNIGMQRTVAAMARSNKVPSGQTASETSKS